MSVLFIDDSGESHTEWPPVPVGGGRLSSRPRAVEFNIELEDYGEIWRLIETTS
jgi:hypothetical protein